MLSFSAFLELLIPIYLWQQLTKFQYLSSSVNTSKFVLFSAWSIIITCCRTQAICYHFPFYASFYKVLSIKTSILWDSAFFPDDSQQEYATLISGKVLGFNWIISGMNFLKIIKLKKRPLKCSCVGISSRLEERYSCWIQLQFVLQAIKLVP